MASRPVFHELASAVEEFGVTQVPWMLSYDYRFDAVTLVNLVQDPDGLQNLSGRGLPVEKPLLQVLAAHLGRRRSCCQSTAAPVGSFRANPTSEPRPQAILGKGTSEETRPAYH